MHVRVSNYLSDALVEGKKRKNLAGQRPDPAAREETEGEQGARRAEKGQDN